jgi:molecular chaperone GrpE
MSKDKKDNTAEDIVYEEGAESPGLSDCEVKLKKVKEELKQVKSEKQEYLDGWQRAKADLVNYKKRSEEDKKDFIKYANEDFILEILPVIENFEQAFKNKEVWEKIDKNWTTGIEFIYNQLKKVLEEKGVLEINPMGQEFDPNIHHSIEIIEIEDKKDDGKILEVVQKGYKLGEKIIKHPNVKVGKTK